ncbi:MAG: hypothetical protein ACFCVD_08830 [Nodosilinea sp.]
MNSMKRFFHPIFQVRALRQLLVGVVASALILMTVACGATQAAAPIDTGSSSITQPEQGMYPHTDTNLDTRAADAKAKRLIRQAEQRTQSGNGMQGYAERVTPDQPLGKQAKDLGQSARQAAEDVGQSVQRAAENAAENTQKSFENLTQNAQNAVERGGDSVKRATDPN